MSITSKVIKGEAANTFPKLMIGQTNAIILFFNERNGTVLSSEAGSLFIVGERCQSLVIDNFRPFTGTLQLSNGDM